MFTYLIKIEYLGTNFVGWQAQKNGISIQEVLEKKLSKFLKENIKIIGSGRTDSGVHALEQAAHFKTKKLIEKPKKFVNSINFFLKNYSISVLNISKKPKKFHARHSALKRVYKYVIINRHSELTIDKNKAWHVKKKIDLKQMKAGAKILKGTHDFSTFRSSSCNAKSPIKTLKKIAIVKKKNQITLTFTSRSFLQQQVRSMVGALKYLGEGKWNLKHFKMIFSSKNRNLCAPPAPSCGLYLAKIFY